MDQLNSASQASELESRPQTAHPVLDVHHTACCIVGSGPAGAMLSLFLARQGIPVTLLEMHKDFDREFRGDTIHPSTMEILDQIGLAGPLHQMPHSKISGPTFQFASGTFRPFDLQRLKTKYPYIFLVAQAKLLEFITGEAARYPSFRLVMQARAQELVQENGVVTGVRYQAPDGWHEVRSSLVVGADGRFSQIRQLLGISPLKKAPPMDVLWFRLPRLPEDPIVSGGAFGGVGQGRIFIVLDRVDYWQAGLVFPKGQYQELRALGVEAVRKSIAESEPRFTRNAESLTDWRQFSLLSVEANLCELWHKPGVLLIGDAAHVMSPVGGVGINYAIQDAAVAANVLAGPLKSGSIEKKHLAEVQSQRMWPTKVIQGMQTIMQKRLIAPTLQSQNAASVPLSMRMLVRLPLLGKLPPRLIAFGARRVRLKPELVTIP